MPKLVPVIRRLERAVGGRLEKAVETGRLTDPLLYTARVLRFARGSIDCVRAGTLHALYMPTNPDVRRLTAAVARLESEIHDLGVRAEEQQESTP